ncbi:N-acetyltransferase [Sphingomonas sp.]|uniref:GNAT family N-acetyltransferase n=1 Tax=Sphingomonas sp. TaxID=28214 RepID=UPI002EDA855D
MRSAGVDDAERLALIAGAAFLDTFAGILDGDAIARHCGTVLSAASFVSCLGGGGAAWLGEAETGRAPLGYALVATPDLPDALPGDLELKRIYLLSRMHGAGLGRALLEQAMSHARAAGFERLTLGVFHANTRAIGFYRHLGFEPIATRKFRVGTIDYDDVVLALRLD